MGTHRLFLHPLLNTCTIRTWTNSGDDNWGQPTQVWSDLATGVKCRLWTQETNRPFEIHSPTTGEIVRAEFEVFIPLTSDTWNSTTRKPKFDEQDALVFTSPVALTLNIELVAVRSTAKREHHIECFANRAVP